MEITEGWISSSVAGVKGGCRSREEGRKEEMEESKDEHRAKKRRDN
jgi:hypothetical protein